MQLSKQLLSAAVLWAASTAPLAAAAPEPASPVQPTKTTTTKPCTASSTGGAFYDLRPDIAVVLEPGTKPKNGIQTSDYTARGYDYGANFTINICAPVVAPVDHVYGLDRSLWGNISAYYTADGEAFSLGQQTTQLISRGRELVLQYTGGSPCPNLKKENGRRSYDSSSTASDEAGDASSSSTAANSRPTSPYASSPLSSNPSKSAIRRKSASFAFLCDRDPTAGPAHISYVGNVDECAYFFKIRSQHACATAEPHKPGSVGPGGVFAIIFGVALLVYFIGGIVYQRTVAHARGWRQLPNYTLWAGIWSFFRDMAIIMTSSCVRCLPGHRGYHSVSSSPPNGRSRSRDDENRLIDQLDEEWED